MTEWDFFYHAFHTLELHCFESTMLLLPGLFFRWNFRMYPHCVSDIGNAMTFDSFTILASIFFIHFIYDSFAFGMFDNNRMFKCWQIWIENQYYKQHQFWFMIKLSFERFTARIIANWTKANLQCKAKQTTINCISCTVGEMQLNDSSFFVLLSIQFYNWFACGDFYPFFTHIYSTNNTLVTLIFSWMRSDHFQC